MEKNATSSKTYAEALEVAQTELKELSKIHGVLKKWCTVRGLDYKSVVKLKNGSASYPLPQLLLRVLTALNFQVFITNQVFSSGKAEMIFIITKLEPIEKIEESEAEKPVENKKKKTKKE